MTSDFVPTIYIYIYIYICIYIYIYCRNKIRCHILRGRAPSSHTPLALWLCDSCHDCY